MTARNQERSDRIVANATRVIEITARLDETLDEAGSLLEKRQQALRELASLADLTVGAYPTPPVDYVRSVAETVLLILMLAGSAGATREELAVAAEARLGGVVPGDELGKAISKLTAANEIILHECSYFAARVGRPVRRRRTRTVGDLIAEVLHDAPEPVGVSEIRKAMIAKGNTYPRTTIQPVLARMARAGEVEHRGTKWLLAKST